MICSEPAQDAPASKRQRSHIVCACADASPSARCRFVCVRARKTETVCQRAFASLHGISISRVRRIAKASATAICAPKDKRGQHKRVNCALATLNKAAFFEQCFHSYTPHMIHIVYYTDDVQYTRKRWQQMKQK